MKDKKIPTFGKWVRIELITRGWTITQLAKLIDYPRETTSAAIHGANFPHTQQAIAELLGHDPEKHPPIPARPARPEKRIRPASKG